MKCPVCRVKGGKPHRPGCPDAPLDPTTHLARVEEWAGTVNARLAALEAPQAYPDGAPPGVVSPHIRQNLTRLEGWLAAYVENPASFQGDICALVREVRDGHDIPVAPTPGTLR